MSAALDKASVEIAEGLEEINRDYPGTIAEWNRLCALRRTGAIDWSAVVAGLEAWLIERGAPPRSHE